MRRLITVLAALAFLGAFFVVAPVPAAVLPNPGFNPPPSVEYPTEDFGLLKPVKVTERSVTLWGWCPTAHQTYFIAFAPTDGSGPGRMIIKEFEKPVSVGYARLGGLAPDTEYRFVVKVLDGLRWAPIGSVKATTLELPEYEEVKVAKKKAF